MRAQILSFALLAGLATSAAAAPPVIPPVTYPTLARTASTAEGFAPTGWTVEQRQSGDLNGDGRPDLVLILRDTSAANVVDNSGLGRRRLNTNPRMLAVAYAETGGFRLVLQNHSLIPRETDPVLDDFIEGGGISMGNGTFKVRLRRFASAGSWGVETVAYTFKPRGDRIEMIGYDRTSTQRNSGETRDVSINYVSGRMKITTGTISGSGERSVWRQAPGRAMPLDQIGDGLDFDAEHPSARPGAN